jgi:hypothetical protein
VPAPSPLSRRAESSTGTVLVIGDYATAQAASVTISDVRELLQGAGYDSGGRLETIGERDAKRRRCLHPQLPSLLSLSVRRHMAAQPAPCGSAPAACSGRVARLLEAAAARSGRSWRDLRAPPCMRWPPRRRSSALHASDDVAERHQRTLLHARCVRATPRADNIGRAMGVADLLLRQRDGLLQEKMPLSRCARACACGGLSARCASSPPAVVAAVAAALQHRLCVRLRLIII